MLYSFNGNYPQPIGNRIRLSNGKTKTDSSTFTDEDLADAGYQLAPDIPARPDNVIFCKLEWNGTDWEYRVEPTITEIQEERQKVLNAIDYLLEEARATRKLKKQNGESDVYMDQYIMELTNLIANVNDPFNIKWPVYGDGNIVNPDGGDSSSEE